jgi:hypothetical protein
MVQQKDLNQFENDFKLTTETMEFYCTIGFYTLLAFQRHLICYFLDLWFERYDFSKISGI